MAFDDALIGTDDFDPATATEDLIRRTAGGPLPPTLSPNMLNTRLARKLGQEPPAPKLEDDEEEKPARGQPLDFSQQAVPAPTNPSDQNPDFSTQAVDPNAPAAPPAQPGLGVSGNAIAAIKGVPVGAAQAIGGAVKGAGQALGNAQPTPAETYAAAGIDPQTLVVPPTQQELETPAAKNPNNAITRAGQAIQKNAGDLENVYREKLGLPAQPPLMSDAEKASIGGTVGQMAGGIAPYAAISAVNAPLGIAAGFAGMAADTYGRTYDDAKGKGASDEQAETAARNSALVAGALGSLPLGAGKLAKSLIAKAATSAAAFTTLGEAQEWALQEIAKGYDKDAGYTPEAKRIIAELILGAGVGAMHGLGGHEEQAAAPGAAAPGTPPAGALPGAGAGGPQPGAGPQPRGFTGRSRYDAGNAWWERERTDGTWEQWVPPGAQHPGAGSAGAGGGPQGGPQPGAGPAGGGARAQQPPPGGGPRNQQGGQQQRSGPPPGTGEGKTEEFKFADAAIRAKMEKIYRHFEPGKDPSKMSDGDLYNAVNDHLRDTSATGASAQEDTAEEQAQRAAHQKRREEDEILKSAGWTDAHVSAMSEEQRARYVNEIKGHQARAQAGPQPGAQQQRQAPPEQPQQTAPPPKAPKAAKVEEPPAAAETATGRREAPIIPKTADDVTKALAAEPTPAQAAAGNYQHAHMELPHLGLEGEHGISTETGVGQTRIRTDADGKTHEVRMQGGAYGYIKGTTGADGDHLDIKIGPHPQSPYVFVIDQHDPKTGKFDELKVMAGYRTPLDAMHGYAIDYDDQAEGRIGHVTAMGADEFKAWLKKGDHTKGLKPPASTVSQEEAGGQGNPLTEAPVEGPVTGVPKVSPARGGVTAGVSAETNTATQEGSKPSKSTSAGVSTGSQEPLGLLQFIASKGGLKPHPELEALDLRSNHRVQIPGRKGFFGVVRPTGDDLDRMREKAEEAGYLRGEGQKTSTVQDLLDAIDNELRGQRHAAEGEEGHETRRERQARAEREAHEHGKAQELVDTLEAAGHGELGPEIKARVLKLMAVHGMDPDTAIDTALIQLDAEEGIEPEQIDATFGPGAHDEANLAATYGHGAPGAPEGGEGGGREAEAPAESRARAPDQGEATERTGEVQAADSDEAVPIRLTRLAKESPTITAEKGADNRKQLVMPGAEKISQGAQAQRAAAKPMQAKAPQKGMDIGLFGTEKDQVDMIDMIRSTLKKDADKVEPADIERAAEIKAQNPEMDVATAFGRAVVENAVDQGFLTKEEAIEAYGPQAEDVLEPEREGASRGGEPAEPQGAASNEVGAGGAEEAGELPGGGEAGRGEGAEPAEAGGGAVESPEGAGPTEFAAAGTGRIPTNETGNAAENESAAGAEVPLTSRIKDAYDEIARENGGVTGAPIGELMKRTGISKEDMHDWIMARVKTRAATIHPTTREMGAEPEHVRAAAINLPGHEPLMMAHLKPAAFETSEELRPMDMAELATMAQRIFEGRITADELKEGFRRAVASKDAIKAELDKKTIKQLMPGGARGYTKKQIIDRKFEAFLDAFNVHGGFTWSPFSETLESALKRQVEKTTDADIAAARERRIAATKERQETYTNPQTLPQFESFIRVRGEDQLNPEQRKRYDELVAERNQAERAREQERSAKIAKVETPAEMKLVETKHSQKGHDLFVVQMSTRVERETYDKLNTAAKKLGGYYSSYNKSGAVPGFQFKTREAAETFMAVKEGDVSRSALNAAKAEERQLNAVDNLRAQADTMTRAADELISIDRKVNTHRRAQQAAGAEARAAADKALATSMRNIANAIESGEAKHLGFVRTKSEIEMMDRLLRNARRRWVEKQKPANYGEYTKMMEGPTTEEMVEGSSYPYPSVHVEDAIRMATAVMNVNGAKMAARRVIKDAEFDQGEKRWRYVADNLGKQDDLRTIAEAMQKIQPNDFPAQTALESFADYARLRRIGINDLPSLRAALREYLAYRGKEGKVDPIKAAERALIGRKIPGYFPTPPELVDRMIEAADIKPGMKVLEPSAGKGNIADKVRAVVGEGNVDAIEPNSDLRKILEAKGHKLVGRDFMEERFPEDSYDRVVMNPPFENGQDVLHVYRAYDMLMPGGRLVAIMSEHPFFATDQRSEIFRQWLKNHGTSEKLPEGSFANGERSTGVNTRLVVINKPQLPGMEHFETGRPLGDSAQAYVLAQGRKDGVEHLIAITPDGRVHASVGVKKSVDWPESVKHTLRTPGGNVVAHHNHPSGQSFSDLDISALAMPGLHTLWAHGHSDYVYRVSLRPEAGRVMPHVWSVGQEKLYNRYHSTENHIYNPIKRYWANQAKGGDATIGKSDLEHLINHLISRVLDDAGIIDYQTNYEPPANWQTIIPGLNNAYKQAVAAAQRDFFYEPDAKPNGGYSYIAGHPGNVGTALDRGQVAARLPIEGGGGEARESGDSDEAPRDVTDRGVTLGALGDPSRVLKEFKNFWTSTFQPELVTDRALTSDPLFARYRSAQAQEKDAIVRASESEWNYWNKKNDAARLDFLRRFERARYGVTFASPREEAMARRYRAMLDANWAEEQRWGSTASFVDDYMPHIWEKPGEWRAFSEAKSAQMGPTWFQKKRTIDYIDEGLAAGLKLKYTNPVDIVVHRLLSGVDMRMRMQLLYGLKDEGLSWEGKQGGDQLIARGWRRIVAPDRKEWVIHPDAQTLWKNAVDAKGFWQDESPGGSMFRGWMALKNAWVPAKLAFSAFHPLHVQHINYADGMARGWDLLVKGKDPVGALKAVADGFMRPVYSAPGAYTGATLGGIAGSFVGMPGWGAISGAVAGSMAFKGLKRAGLAKDVDTLGKRGRAAWHTRPSRQTPEQKALVSLMQDGGFVPQLSEQLKIAAKRQLAVSFQKALRREAGAGDYRKLISAAMRRPLEIMQAPIFERWIPELKTAAYLNAASDLLRRRPELWTNHNDRRLALRAIAKSIDNRFGEMFYGNLFWNRYLKDAGIASFLSLGWNLGFVREFGGAALETISRPLGLIPGLKPSAPRKVVRSATNKIPFVIAYVASAALINGLMTALFTGEHPSGMDWIFARIGGQNPDGSPRRVTNMFYLREVPMLIKHVQERGGNVLSGAGEMIWNKMMLEPFTELMNNRDYYGYNIWDENAPIYKQIWQALHHTFGDQNPMALSGAQQAARLSGHEFPSTKEAIEHPDRLLDALRAKGVDLSILGFGPAPSYVEKSSIQNRIGYLYRQHVAPVSKPNADEETSVDKMAVRTAIMIAKRDKDSEMLNLARERGRALGMTPKYLADIGKTPTDVYLFSRLPDADQRSLLADASSEERARYLQHAHLKVRQEINRARLAPQPVQ